MPMKRWWLVFGLGLALPVMAQTDLVKTDLTQAIGALDQAASKRDVSAVLAFYAPSFKNNDGLDKTQLTEQLTALWRNLTNPTYTTEVVELKPEGTDTLVTTRTVVTGQWVQGNLTFSLKATAQAQNQWQLADGKWTMVKQTIMSEQSTLTSGLTPPEVTVKLPERVAPGKSYELSAILSQPLEDKIVLAAVNQGPAGQPALLQDLDDLRAGGLFKKNTVPTVPGDQMISLGFVQGSGMYFFAQRLHVE